MQQQRDNLAELIKVSPILNAQERPEWLEFLNLMDDKQTLELERILKSAGPLPAVRHVEPPPAIIAVTYKPTISQKFPEPKPVAPSGAGVSLIQRVKWHPARSEN